MCVIESHHSSWSLYPSDEDSFPSKHLPVSHSSYPPGDGELMGVGGHYGMTREHTQTTAYDTTVSEGVCVCVCVCVCRKCDSMRSRKVIAQNTDAVPTC